MSNTEQVREVAASAVPVAPANWDSNIKSMDRGCVALTVCWGDEVMLSRQLDDKSGFTLGASSAAGADFVLDEQHLGAATWQLVRRVGATPVLQIPVHASGYVEFPGEAGVTLEVLRSKLGPIDSGHELQLPRGARAVIALGSVVFDLHHTQAEAPWARNLGTDVKPVAAYFGASFVSAAAFLAAMAFFVPPMGLNDGEQIDSDRIYLLQQYLDAAAEREETEREQPAANVDSQAGGKDGAKAMGDEGALGKPEAAKTNNKLAVKGPSDNPKPELSPREQAVSFGMIGLLAGGFESDSLTAPWQRDPAIGADPMDAAGAMWGDELGENAGNGGLGLLGLGEGGGGHRQGIGLTNVGTIGSSGSCDDGPCAGIGVGDGRSWGRPGAGHHETRVPRMVASEPSVSGRLPPQVIQRIVRQNFGRFRMCYEKALSQNPNLQGRVQVRFMIDRSGAVSNALNAGSSLPDAAAVGCVVRGFYGLSFPKPEAGSVQVSYPIMFSPG